MKQIPIRSVKKLLANKSELEKKLKVKIEITGRAITIDGDELDEYVTERVIEAMDLGFSAKVALLLLEEDYMLEAIGIKSFTKKNPSVVRARIIGTKRKTLNTIEEITGCHVVLHENSVGIIGNAEDIKGALQAIISLVKGSKTANVYSYLERLNSRRQPFVLALKKPKGQKEEEIKEDFEELEEEPEE